MAISWFWILPTLITFVAITSKMGCKAETEVVMNDTTMVTAAHVEQQRAHCNNSFIFDVNNGF